MSIPAIARAVKTVYSVGRMLVQEDDRYYPYSPKRLCITTILSYINRVISANYGSGHIPYAGLGYVQTNPLLAHAIDRILEENIVNKVSCGRPDRSGHTCYCI